MPAIAACHFYPRLRLIIPAFLVDARSEKPTTIQAWYYSTLLSVTKTRSSAII